MNNDKSTPQVWEYILGRKFTGEDYSKPITKEEFIILSKIEG
jgi:hypothetical protein